jgi:hypothetical protein
MPVLKNAKHERFAQEVSKGKTAEEAYVSAGYLPSRKNASRLRTNEGIQSRIEEILSRAAEKVAVTVHDIAIQLDEDRAFAKACGAASAAVAATMGKAKVLGLIVDKTTVSGPGGAPMEHRVVVEFVRPPSVRSDNSTS